MRLSLKIITITITVFILVLFTPFMDAVADVYLVYSGKNRKLKEEIVEGISGDFPVKTYNTGLLELADYSGLQKVVSKISRARVVVMLYDTTMEAFKGNTFHTDLIVIIHTDLIVINSSKTNVMPQNKIRYILDKSVDVSELGNDLNTSIISSIAELNDNGADVLIIDESTINISKVLRAILKDRNSDR
jgi:hypothetical protein